MLKPDLYGDRFRPTKEQHLIGKTQINAWKSLKTSFEEGRLKNKILFIGETGLGKTTIAEMYIRLILGLDPSDSLQEADIHYFNGGDESGVDVYRQGLISALDRRPLGGGYKIFFIDEIHRLSNAAQNALLTPVEHLPSWAILIVATSEPHKMIDALRQGRFQDFELRKPTSEDFKQHAARIFKAVNYQGSVDMAVIDDIIISCKGSIRKFVELIQSYVEGSYVKSLDDQDSDFALDLIKGYSGNDVSAKIIKVFRDAEKLADKSYEGLAAQLGGYAIAFIMRGASGTDFSRACALLEAFGDGLSPYSVSPKVAFYVALKRYMEFRK